MLDEQDLTNVDQKGIPFTVRSVFIVDPKKKIRCAASSVSRTARLISLAG
jgi:alkyl hydroperoxide reductase subunit AhpC